MSVPYIWLVNQAGDVYQFPPDFFIKDDGWSMISNVQHPAYGMGGRDLGDDHLEHRTILLEGAVRADTLGAQETKIRSMQKALISGGKLYVSDDPVTRFIMVSNPKVDSQYIGEYRNEKIVNVSFLALDPFWQADVETVSEHILTVTGPTTIVSFSVDNRGSDSIVYPLFLIEADQGEDIPGLRLTNFNDGGMSLEYNDPTFRQGDYLEIDSYYGTVKKNGNDSFLYFTKANFLRLQPMINNFEYEGASCTLSVIFRKVYL